MKKLTAFWVVTALTAAPFLGASLAKADDQPASPVSQITSDQGSPAEPQPAEQQSQVEQVKEEQPQQDQTQEQDQPAPELAPQPDQQK